MGLTFLIKIISVYMTYMIINNNRKIKLHLTCKFMKKNTKINFLRTIRKHLPHKLCNFFFQRTISSNLLVWHLKIYLYSYMISVIQLRFITDPFYLFVMILIWCCVLCQMSINVVCYSFWRLSWAAWAQLYVNDTVICVIKFTRISTTYFSRLFNYTSFKNRCCSCSMIYDLM